MTTPAVYKAISDVSAAMSSAGIGKDRKNQMQGYNFRGIDDVLNALSPALVHAGLVILPRVISRECVERVSAKGGAIFYVTVYVEFDLIATVDGSKHTVVTFGEAMDSADKATNKAMSAAYKYLALLTFCIPTEASPDTDADFTTHEVKGNAAAEWRKKWLADWLAAIDGVHSSGELKRVIADAVADARNIKDTDAETQFISAGEAKVAKAKAAAAKTEKTS